MNYDHIFEKHKYKYDYYNQYFHVLEECFNTGDLELIDANMELYHGDCYGEFLVRCTRSRETVRVTLTQVKSKLKTKALGDFYSRLRRKLEGIIKSYERYMVESEYACSFDDLDEL